MTKKELNCQNSIEKESLSSDSPLPMEVKKKKDLFHIKQRGSTYGREILAGIIVFLSVIYILPVNSSILSDAGMDSTGVFAATAIASALCTMIMGLVAGYPIVLSSAMGMNAFFAYTICCGLGYSWQEALALLFIAGILYLIMTLTPLRKMIMNAIPKDIKQIISAGLGFFICFVGLRNSGIISLTTNSTGIASIGLGDLSNPSILLALLGIILVFVFSSLKLKFFKRFSILLSMLTVALLGLILGWCGIEGLPKFDFDQDWIAVTSIDKVFGQLFSGSNFINVLKNPKSYALIFVLIFVHLFDTTATLLAVGKDAGFINEKGELDGGEKAMLADAIGSVICAPIGTSTVTPFSESSIGIEVGGRTGLTSIVAAFLFIISLFIYPLLSIFSFSCVTAMALVYVGSSIVIHNLNDINWKDPAIGVCAFITVIMITLTYSLSSGIGFGIIIYVVIMLASSRAKEINPILYILALLFVINFTINALI